MQRLHRHNGPNPSRGSHFGPSLERPRGRQQATHIVEQVVRVDERLPIGMEGRRSSQGELVEVRRRSLAVAHSGRACPQVHEKLDSTRKELLGSLRDEFAVTPGEAELREAPAPPRRGAVASKGHAAARVTGGDAIVARLRA